MISILTIVMRIMLSGQASLVVAGVGRGILISLIIIN